MVENLGVLIGIIDIPEKRGSKDTEGKEEAEGEAEEEGGEDGEGDQHGVPAHWRISYYV